MNAANPETPDEFKTFDRGDMVYRQLSELMGIQQAIRKELAVLEQMDLKALVESSITAAFDNLVTNKVDIKLEQLISVGKLREAVDAALAHQRGVLTETIKGVTAAIPEILRREIGKVIAEEVRINLRAEVQRAVAEGLANMATRAPDAPVASSAHISASRPGIS